VSGWPRGHRYTPSCAVERKPSPRDADEPPDAAGLHAVAVGYFARLGFELITFRHEPVARALAAPLAARGYRPVHELLMLLARFPSRSMRPPRSSR
jgi:hypothetical protein